MRLPYRAAMFALEYMSVCALCAQGISILTPKTTRNYTGTLLDLAQTTGRIRGTTRSYYFSKMRFTGWTQAMTEIINAGKAQKKKTNTHHTFEMIICSLKAAIYSY